MFPFPERLKLNNIDDIDQTATKKQDIQHNFFLFVDDGSCTLFVVVVVMIFYNISFLLLGLGIHGFIVLPIILTVFTRSLPFRNPIKSEVVFLFKRTFPPKSQNFTNIALKNYICGFQKKCIR